MRFYLYGDGCIWRIPQALILASASMSQDEWYDTATSYANLMSVKFNSTRGSWPKSRLPSGVVAYSQDSELYEGVGVRVCSTDELDADMLASWRSEVTS
jgi:hypothetical protein